MYDPNNKPCLHVRWAGAGKIRSGNYTIIYSGGEKHGGGGGMILDSETAKTTKGF